MHLPDHYLDPTICAATAAVAGGAICWSVHQARQQRAASLPLLAAVSAAIFAAQMVNFPVAAGTSGHFIGGAMAGILLGPWLGLLSISIVLVVQALVFNDGGIAALGANILNMGLIGAVGGSAVFTICRRGLASFSAIHERLADAIAAMIAGWCSVVLAAAACSLELAFSGKFALADVAGGMLAMHAVIGGAEGIITAVAVALLGVGIAWRPVAGKATPVVPGTANGYAAAWLIGIAVLTAGLLSPLASAEPDGLEHVAEPLAGHLGDARLIPMDTLLLDYAIPIVNWEPLATALAGLLGIAIVYLLATLLERATKTPAKFSH